MQTRMEELMKERDEAAEAHALMELEWREANRSARDANEKWEQLKQELMELRARRDRWIYFLKGRMEEGAGTSKGVAKEEGLLRRVLEKVTTLARAVVEAREQVVCELAEMRELERLQELAMLRVAEMHQRLEEVAAERIQATCRGTQGRAEARAAAGRAVKTCAEGTDSGDTAPAGARAGNMGAAAKGTGSTGPASSAAAAGARGAA
eukprot:SAG11_NODE_11306_length_769_cov_3.859701_1_plen_207_part_10